MDKQQLIQSFNEMKQSLEAVKVPDGTVIPTGTWVSLAIALIVIAWTLHQVFSGTKGEKFKLSNIDVIPFFAFCILPLVMCLISANNFYKDANEPKVLDILEKNQIEASWKSDVFVDQYVKNLPLQSFEVTEHYIDEEGVSVILDTSNSLAVLKDITKIKYVNSDQDHIEAKWVEGLEEIDLPSKYYDVTLYLQEEDKESK